MPPTFSCDFKDYLEDSIPFYNEEYENELLNAAGFGSGFGESDTAVDTVGESKSNMSVYSDSFPIDYFLDYAEVDTLPPIDFDFDEYVPADEPTDVKLEVPEPTLATRREPYQKPSREDSQRRKRGRPTKVGSSSKMASYSRQYREMKKKQLALFEGKTEKLEKENDDLRAQVKELTNYTRKLEAELKKLKDVVQQQQFVPRVPVMAVGQPN